MIVQELITNAVYNSLQDREFQPQINSGYMLFGLYELNNILDEWRDKIPFDSVITFNNVENLMNSKFVEVSTINYILNKVSYPIELLTLNRYKEIETVVDLQGFPAYAFFDELTQSIKIYPLPSTQPYQFTVWGKLQQINLGLFDQLPLNMPTFMRSAVTQELSFRLCAQFDQPWDAKKESIRQDTLAGLVNKRSIDLSPQRDISLGVPGSRSAPTFPYFYFISGGTG